MRLTKAEHEQDSLVLGTILAGRVSRQKRLQPGLSGVERTQTVCALGASNIGTGINKPQDVLHDGNLRQIARHELFPMLRFVKQNAVNSAYACGVNDGFENNVGAHTAFFKRCNMKSRDYARGWTVGQAARDF